MSYQDTLGQQSKSTIFSLEVFELSLQGVIKIKFSLFWESWPIIVYQYKVLTSFGDSPEKAQGPSPNLFFVSDKNIN